MINRQVYQLKAGNLDNMTLQEEPLAAPGPREVSVAVKAIGLNFADVFAIWGLYSATPKGVFTPGLEYSGEIVAVGAEVDQWKAGDKIMGITRFGAYASHLNIDADYVIALPDGWRYEEGASYLVQVLTAYYALVPLGNLQEGYGVLIHSAAGGVGLWANRIAKHWNAYTIGTVGHASKLELLQSEGYDQGIVRGPNFAEDLQQALDGRPLHLLLECIGGKVWQIGYAALAPMGRCVIYGSARYASVGKRPNYLKVLYHHLTRPRLDPQSTVHDNKAVMGFNLIWLYEQKELMHQLLNEIAALDIGRPHIGQTYPFQGLADAILHFQSGKTVGKQVVVVEK